MHRNTISKRETVTQFNNLMAQFNEGIEHNRIRTLQIFEKIKETTSKSVAITEKQVTTNMAGPP